MPLGHESGIIPMEYSKPMTYEPISPELVGRKRGFRQRKHAGAHGIRAILADFGIQPTGNSLHKIIEKQKVLADKGKSVTTSQLLAIASEVMGIQNLKRNSNFMIFHIIQEEYHSKAVIRLNAHGKMWLHQIRGWSCRCGS